MFLPLMFCHRFFKWNAFNGDRRVVTLFLQESMQQDRLIYNNIIFLLVINAIKHEFEYCKFMIFADNIKLHFRFDSTHYSKLLQEHLNPITEQAHTRHLNVCTPKYNVPLLVLTIPWTFNNSVNDINLEYLRIISDLVIPFDRIKSFYKPVETIYLVRL